MLAPRSLFSQHTTASVGATDHDHELLPVQLPRCSVVGVIARVSMREFDPWLDPDLPAVYATAAIASTITGTFNGEGPCPGEERA